MKLFSTYSLPATIIKALADQNISEPTDVQEKCITTLLSHKDDFVCRSPTGTGKTYAFGIPLIARLQSENKNIQALVLVPTRELCEQVNNALQSIGKGTDSFSSIAVYGGVPIKTQEEALKELPQIVVATPGRLLDLLEKRIIDLQHLSTLVYDEADEMLSKGFIDDIDKILLLTGHEHRSWLFSATLPNRVNKLIAKYLNNDVKKVLIGEELSTNKQINHRAIIVKPTEKLDILLNYVNRFIGDRGIIFCRTKSGVQKLYKQLSAKSIKSVAIHGDLPQGIRTKAMDQFREKHINILLATDVAARGVDIPDLQYVIQYHIPDTTDAYTHRSGRTARAGKTGECVTLLFEEEREQMTFLNDSLELGLKYDSKPTKGDQLFNLSLIKARKIAKFKPDAHIDEAQLEIFKQTLSHMSKDEILVKLIAYLQEN